jgi:twinkle protein
MGVFVRHEACPNCGSRDNLARYQDGSAHCFGCKYNEQEGEVVEMVEDKVSEGWSQGPLTGEYMALKNRGISKATCEFARYQVGMYNGEPVHIANHYEGGQLIAQKLRLPGKRFMSLGPGRKDMPLWLQDKWQRSRHLAITEGEIDALTVLEVQECKWPVMSLPNGTGSVKQLLKRRETYEALLQYDRIVLMFDMDEPGQAAADEFAAAMPPGRCCIAKLPEKDANDTLLKHGPGALIRAFWDAAPWRPDGIVSGEIFTLETLKQAAVRGYELPRSMAVLQDKMLGVRKGEITLLTAGSGIGKSTVARELGYHLHQVHGLSIGNVYLEENNVKTAQGFVAIHNSVPLGRLRHDTSLITDEQWNDAIKKVLHQRMWFYDHFGSLESKNLMAKLRYFAAVLKVDFIFLDHISIVVSGIESSKEGERKDLDMLMTQLRSLCEETGVGIIAIVHLKRTDKNYNEGAVVSLNDLRGSASLEQISDNVISLERDQQLTAGGDSEKMTEVRFSSQDEMIVRLLKCREMGDLGECDKLKYDRDTGRIKQALHEKTAFEEV